MSSTTLSSSPSTSFNNVHETKFVIIYVPIIVPAQHASSNGGIRIDDVLKMNASVLKSPLVKKQVIDALNQADRTPLAGPNKYGFELYSESEEPKCGEDGSKNDAVSGLDATDGCNLNIDSGPVSVSNKQCVKRGSMESTTPSSLETQYCSYLPSNLRWFVQQRLVLQRSSQHSSILSATTPSSDTQYCFDSSLHLPQPGVPGGSLISTQWVNWNNNYGVWTSNNSSVQPWPVRERFEGGFQCYSFSSLQFHHQRSLQPCEMHSSEISGQKSSFGRRKSCERLSCSCRMHRDSIKEMASNSLEGRILNGSVFVQKFSKISQHENKWYFANRISKLGAKAKLAKAVQAHAALAA